MNATRETANMLASHFSFLVIFIGLQCITDGVSPLKDIPIERLNTQGGKSRVLFLVVDYHNILNSALKLLPLDSPSGHLL